MKLTNLIAAGLTATLLSTSVSYAQTAPTTPAEVQVLVKNEAAADMPEVQALVEQLKAQGFSYIEIRSTLLGRARVLAYSANSVREIVLSAATGEILRDVERASDGAMAAGHAVVQAAEDGATDAIDDAKGAVASVSGKVGDAISGGMDAMSGN